MVRIIAELSIDEVVEKYDRISVAFEGLYYDVYKSPIVRWKIKDQDYHDSAVREKDVSDSEADETVSNISVFLKEQSTKGAKIYVDVRDIECEIILKP